jgi:uncharacterized membrane protein
MSSSPVASASTRRTYIDWARGIAVLIMLLAHSSDSWVRRADRSSATYNSINLVAGFGAPLFLFLAGVALVLAAERHLSRNGSRRKAAEAIVRRGLEIFILAFLFRIQAFIVSPGSWAVTIFRVDILNVMGPAIAVGGLVWGATTRRLTTALTSASLATLLAMVTPIVRTAHWVDLLPTWFQWYVRPMGDNTTFTLLPWAAFVFAGTACGAVLASASEPAAERRRMAGFAAAAVALIAGGFYAASLPSIYRESSFWTSSPTFFAIRTGILTAALVVLFELQQARHRLMLLGPLLDVIERFGRNSLFVYWIHVELAYGYASWLIRQRLPLWGYAVAYLVFAAAMYRAIDLRDWVVHAWRNGWPARKRARTVAA